MKHIRSRTWPSLARLKNQDGFTIVELMVAITVFALLMAAAALGLNGALNLTRNNRSRAVAANLASQTVDNIQAKPFDQIPIGNSTTTSRWIRSPTRSRPTRSGSVRPRSPATAPEARAPTPPTFVRRSP